MLIKRTGANKQNLEGGYLSGMFQRVVTMLQVLIEVKFERKNKFCGKIFCSGIFYFTISLGA